MVENRFGWGRTCASLGVAVSLAVGCGPHVAIPPDARLGAEYPFPNEDVTARATLDMVRSKLDKDTPPGAKTARDAHPKAHGCVHATFTVDDGLPAELQVGLFRSPGPYRAWIRVSNGFPTPQADAKGDIRGMAIKVTSVPGPKLSVEEQGTQDFLLINHPTLPVGDPAEYRDLFDAATNDRPMSYFFGWNPFQWKLGALNQFRSILGKEVPSTLATRYWSTTPYRMGDGAVKWSAQPCAEVPARMPPDPSDDYLREDLIERLSKGDACFRFMAQLQKDPISMPIEDPAVDWDESASPFVPIATVRIPAQAFDSPAQREFCENLSFDPWHALAEHRPLGGINRVRKVVYDAISSHRHERNHAARREPNGSERF